MARSLPASIDWPAIDAWFDEAFPGLPQVEVDALARDLAASGVTRPVLLDVRTAREHAVSRLPGAHHAPDLEAALAVLAGRPADTRAVAYCSVGVRSARLAAALRERGFTGVENLRGSIFAWANRGLPLCDARGPVRRVHPFDAAWGRLLEPALRAPAGGPRALSAAAPRPGSTWACRAPRERTGA